MIRSLRLRLLFSTSLAIAVILSLLGFSVYAFMWHRLLAEFDAGEVTKARTIAAMVEMNGSTISFDADLEQMPEFSSKRIPEYFRDPAPRRQCAGTIAVAGKQGPPQIPW